MKQFLKLSFVLFLPAFSFATVCDTTIQGVEVEFTYSQSIFPESWQGGTIKATGEQIDPFEIIRVEPIISKALNKYPRQLLQLNLRAVYFLKSMKFFDVGFGGTNSSDAVYITSNGVLYGYTEVYIEQTFHHEFSSILFRNYQRFFDTTAWKNENETSFEYNDPKNGVGAIENKQSSQNLDSLLAVKGFITQYAMSSLENDINTIAQNLFRPDSNFWTIADRFPRVGRKVKLLIDFYHSLGSIYTENYFRSFAEKNN